MQDLNNLQTYLRQFAKDREWDQFHSPKNEFISWKNSLQYMFNVLHDNDIPASAGVSIEYNIPLTNRRVDFILMGKDANRRDTAVIVELKQWQEVEVTRKDAIVKTRFQHGEKETNHPSYQAWSYAALIEDYNETVRNESIALLPCAYLHNMKTGDAINDDFYAEHIKKLPVFIPPMQTFEFLVIFGMFRYYLLVQLNRIQIIGIQ
jgi:hypothetical protein